MSRLPWGSRADGGWALCELHPPGRWLAWPGPTPAPISVVGSLGACPWHMALGRCQFPRQEDPPYTPARPGQVHGPLVKASGSLEPGSALCCH